MKKTIWPTELLTMLFWKNANQHEKNKMIFRSCEYTPHTTMNFIIWFWFGRCLKLKEEWTLTMKNCERRFPFSLLLLFFFSKNLKIVYGFQICILETISTVYNIFHWVSFLHVKKHFIQLFQFTWHVWSLEVFESFLFNIWVYLKLCNWPK